MSAGTRCSASHPILAIRSCFNLEGYSVGVVFCFSGFGPPLPPIALYGAILPPITAHSPTGMQNRRFYATVR